MAPIEVSIASGSSGDQASPTDLFSSSLVSSYVDDKRFVARPWLLDRVAAAWKQEDTRFILLTGEPGAGKSALMAHLARLHPGALRYFIRRDSMSPLQGGDARTLLFALGYQLVHLHPELFDPKRLEAVVSLRAGRVAAGGRAVGIQAEDFRVSPFYQTSLRVEAHSDVVEGELIGISVGTVMPEPRMEELSNLQYLALLDPAQILAERVPTARIVILVDALDEIRWGVSGESILDWLTACPELPANIRIVLSSRPDADLLRTFRDNKAREITELVLDPEAEMDRAHFTEDVGQFLGRFATEPAVTDALTAHQIEAASFVGQAIDRANGNFQYTVALARGIDAALANDPPGGDLPGLLQLVDVPAETTELYRFFLGKVKDRAGWKVEVPGALGEEPSHEPAWQALYRPLLAILAVAFEPLSDEQLVTYARIPLDGLPKALEDLSQFLDRSPDGRYRLYHATFPEFLTGQATARPADPFHVDPAYWHGLLGGRLIRANTNWLSGTDRYALAHTPTHLAAAIHIGEEGTDDLQKRLTSLLLDPSFLQTKVIAFGPRALVNDIATGLLSIDQASTIHSALSQVQEALILASDIVATRPDELAQQLHARLAVPDDHDLRAFLQRLLPSKETWLRPLHRSLPGPHDVQLSAARVCAGPVSVVKILDEHRLLAGCGRTLKELDLATLTLRRELPVPDGYFDRGSNAILIPNRDLLIASLADGPLTSWDINTGEAQTLDVGGWWSSLCTDRDGLTLLGATGGMLVHWDLPSRAVRRVIHHADDPATSAIQFSHFRAVALTPDGSYVIAANFNGPVQVWNLETGQVERLLEGCPEEPQAFLVRPDGSGVIALGWVHYSKLDVLLGKVPGLVDDGTLFDHDADDDDADDIFRRRVIEWDYRSGRVIRNQLLEGEGFGAPNACELDAERNRIIVASNSGPIHLIDLTEPMTVTNLPGHEGSAWDVALFADGTKAVSAGTDGALKVWDLEQTVVQLQAGGHSGYVTSISIAPDEAIWASAALDGTLVVGHLGAEPPEWKVYSPGYRIQHIHLLGHGRAVAVCYDKKIRLIDIRTLSATVIGDERSAERMLGAALNETRDQVLVGYMTEDVDETGASFGFGVQGFDLTSLSKTVHFWSYNDEENAQAGSLMVFRPTTEQVVTASNHEIRIWAADSGVITARVTEIGAIDSIVVIPDGTRAVLAGDHHLRLLDLDSLSMAEVALVGDSVDAMALSPAGNWLLTAGRDGVAVVWDTSTWTEMASFTGDTALTCGAISATDEVVLGDALGRVHVFRIEEVLS
jgi:WD40 repeat protein